MGKKLKSTCCETYKEGKKFCKDCPKRADLGKKERKKLLAKYAKK